MLDEVDEQASALRDAILNGDPLNPNYVHEILLDRDRLKAQVPKPPRDSRMDFMDALRHYDANPWGGSPYAAKRGLFALWWFIEHVPEDDPYRQQIYSDLRQMIWEVHQ